MIPKDAYVLFCIKSDGTEIVHYPLGEDPLRLRKPVYLSDLNDVNKYIKENLACSYVKVLAAKVIDVFEIGVQSAYKENKND
jgi:hypothetical protein